MDTRRDFLKKVGLLYGASLYPSIFHSIEKALAVEPDGNTSWEDAEHVVILVQENRSFDHIYGTMKGVRGFKDPRNITLPNGNPVWLQQDESAIGHTPFHLSMHTTNATWSGSLPHSWPDQTEARNGGAHDRWIPAKRSDKLGFQHTPLTMGYYKREDIPFYYALADAFTICDQNFCSSLTGTTPNRLYLWTGTIRDQPTAESQPNVLNSDVSYDKEVSWTTFPERLESLGVPWKVYQNELSLPSGLTPEEEDWLSNFTDNPLEWFSQYQVRFAKKDETWTQEKYDALSATQKNLHEKAFCTNQNDSNYRKTIEHIYRDGEKKRKMLQPKGDILYQFREDVIEGRLPQVSWLVPPANFSDHPGSPWYGAWYISQVLEILTQNPEVWKKTIFILTYDENDGYFDHVPPFTPPHPTKPNTGLVSKGIDVGIEHVENREGVSGPIGLGFRVPMMIVSPWTRGGMVCSEVFDHTSVLQFLEKFLTKKIGVEVKETNISEWRRTICGDLTSAFQPPSISSAMTLPFLEKESFFPHIHKKKYQNPPKGGAPFSEADMNDIRKNPSLLNPYLLQEKGTKRSAPLPYWIFVNGQIAREQNQFKIQFHSEPQLFSKYSVGCPFIVYAFTRPSDYQVRNYAVSAGDTLEDTWNLSNFENGLYHFRVYGPNGFFREFQGNGEDPWIQVKLEYESQNVRLSLVNLHPRHAYTFEIQDCSYGNQPQIKTMYPNTHLSLTVPTDSGLGWYDIQLQLTGNSIFFQRFAGRVETGKWGYSDPAMGR